MTLAATDTDGDQLLVTRLAGEPLAGFEPIAGGRNSRVFRVTTVSGRSIAAKFYFSDSRDRRDRFHTELTAFRFLQQTGITATPKLLAADDTARCALIEWVEGVASREGLTPGDLEQLAQFIEALRTAASHPAAAELPLASEAAFSLSALLENIEGRLLALKTGINTANEEHAACAEFLSLQLEPLYDEVRALAEREWHRSGPALDTELPRSLATLSASDLGFHNAICRADGRWIFQDFEYFGWDDPAKLFCDLMLHPAMDLSCEQMNHLLQTALPAFATRDERLRDRLRLFYPLFGVKWCAILLNEFLPAAAARRRFAGGEDSAETLRRQLSKARRMEETVRSRYRQLGYYYAL